MIPVSSAGLNENAGIAVPLMPVITISISSPSFDARLNRPLRRSTPATRLPVAPWQTTHCAAKTRAPTWMST